jgi:hypothetical protein
MAPAKQGEADPRTTHSAQRLKKAIEQRRFNTTPSIRHELRFINMNRHMSRPFTGSESI